MNKYLEYTPISLDYDDVTLVSRRISTIDSRDNVDTSMELFPGLKLTVPIIASPMVDVVDRNVAIKVRQLGGFAFLHRFCSVEEQVDSFKFVRECGWECGAAIGLQDMDRFVGLYKYGCRYFVIDVANGANINVDNFINSLLKIYNDVYFLVGNVVSGEQFYWCAGLPNVKAVRVAVGSGCFVKGTLVKTDKKYKSIENIRVGDRVLTHNGLYKKVIGTTCRTEKERIINVNNINCTPNHEFYVINKNDVNNIDNDNIHKFAKWVSAEDLSDDFLLVKITD